jgi:hypothetical protein
MVIDDAETRSSDRLDNLISLFRGLKKDIKDYREETVRLNSALIFEQEKREVETTRLNRRLILEQEKREVETTRLNRELILEQEERKAETTQLNRELILEQEERKAETTQLKEEATRLKTMLFKESKGSQANMARLEGTIERLNTELEQSELSRQQCKVEVAKAKAQQRDDMQAISEVCYTSAMIF